MNEYNSKIVKISVKKFILLYNKIQLSNQQGFTANLEDLVQFKYSFRENQKNLLLKVKEKKNF